MSNYYQNVQKHEKEHEEETRQPIVNATASISSNSPGIYIIIIIIIDTSQHANHEAADEHWIDYIYKQTAGVACDPHTKTYSEDGEANGKVVSQKSGYSKQRANRKLVCNYLCLCVSVRWRRGKIEEKELDQRKASGQDKDIIK
ncbi:hypothetical protein BDF22DRAFT_658225 [Syncephalis plumigaleata]|nr:hypothetical protein BDF22DRAFT_658225 [Syncephalis plumigaleata]